MAGKYNLMALWEFITFAAFPKFDVALDTYTVKESPPKHPKASHSIPFLLLLLPLSFFFFFFQKRPVKFDPIFLFSKEHTHLHTYTHWHTDTPTHWHTLMREYKVPWSNQISDPYRFSAGKCHFCSTSIWRFNGPNLTYPQPPITIKVVSACYHNVRYYHPLFHII